MLLEMHNLDNHLHHKPPDVVYADMVAHHSMQVWWQNPKGSTRLFSVPEPFSFQQQTQGVSVGGSMPGSDGRDGRCVGGSSDHFE